MQERLLQFIWRRQYFNHRQLYTAGGEELHILFPGTLNTHQGPDFLHARIRIGETRWAGHIELHIRNSDWDRHAHQQDPLYRNVILHVVWEDDIAGRDPSVAERGPIPLLVLQHRVSKLFLGWYREWMDSRSFIACERQLAGVGKEIWEGWKRQLLEERLRRQALRIEGFLGQNRLHWEEACWWLIARNFGIPVNGDAFEAIARSLPLSLLARHSGRIDQLEALLMGQAGLLETEPPDEYGRHLQGEFRHLRGKYRLQACYHPVLFLRMRPASMPTVRLAQLAGLLTRSQSWFSRVLEAQHPGELRPLLEVRTSTYWDDHYILAVASVQKLKKPGIAMVDSLLINSFVPLLYAYGRYYRDPSAREKAFRWLEGTGAEKNAQVAGWGRLGVKSKNAADTQALLELKRHYCDPKRCLDCAIGNELLAPGKGPE